MAIEDIEVGDYVLAEDTVTGETEYKEVLKVHVTQTTKLVHVVTEDSTESTTTINTTDNHPFYIEGQGWVPAIELEAGDTLRTADGDVEVVQDVYVEYLDEPVLIYNFEIEGYHTYFVSDERVLVHNNCDVDGDGKPVNNNDRRNTPDQDTVIQLAKEAKQNGGASYDDAIIIIDYANEYGVPNHPIEVHPNRPGVASNIPHFHIGKTGHIPIVGDIPSWLEEVLYDN